MFSIFVRGLKTIKRERFPFRSIFEVTRNAPPRPHPQSASDVARLITKIFVIFSFTVYGVLNFHDKDMRQPGEDRNSVEKIFNFTVPPVFVDKEYSIHLPVKIPMDEPIKEYTHRIMKEFQIPVYLFHELHGSLKQFIDEETVKLYDSINEWDLEEFKNDNINVDDVVKSWEKLFRNETVEYCEPVGTSDEELFSTVYHKLVHSSALESILQEEHAYAITANSADANRRKHITELAEKQNNEMAEAVKDLNIKVTEKDINDMAAKHYEEHSLTAGRLNSEVEALHENQRKQYRAWLMTIFEQQAIHSSPLNSPASGKTPQTKVFSASQNSKPWPLLEESFTIHLGSQMKQMHNVRILSADFLDFCKIRSDIESSTEVEPQRLQTALALYSNGLSGIVLLSDVGPVDGFSGLAKDFADVCQQTTEFHFPTFDQQLQEIKGEIAEAVAWRSRKSKGTADSHQVKRSSGSRNLQTGDMFITKHSNLSQVHVVFHMLSDDSVKSSDINSRHPVILGLRNVLKTAASYDVTTVTLPLLLTHEMTEDMTVAWCSKRAELVFKCVKGFMIEAAGAGGAELHNLQFLVPTGISPEVFSALATMLPSIFRVSNPVIIKNSTDSDNHGTAK